MTDLGDAIVKAAKDALGSDGDPEKFLDLVDVYMEMLERATSSGEMDRIERSKLEIIGDLHNKIADRSKLHLTETERTLRTLSTQGRRVISYIDNFPRVISSVGKRKG